jgi:acyl-CoA hydrolase
MYFIPWEKMYFGCFQHVNYYREDRMQPKKSEPVHNWSFVFPNDINPNGTMFGGKMLALMDMVAGIAASRHCGMKVVIASTDAITFMKPLYAGDRMEVIARVAWAGKTSMVIKTDVFGEDPLTGSRKHCITSHFIMIAIDENHCPAPIPPLLVETEEEKREYSAAELVKKQLLERKNRIDRSAGKP